MKVFFPGGASNTLDPSKLLDISSSQADTQKLLQLGQERQI
jgi:hypothetical protein